VENGKNSVGPRLTSWKEIAAFVGRGERTVKRWEQSRGLPVRRYPGAANASVFAYVDEIEAWSRGHGREQARVPEVTASSAEILAPHVTRPFKRWTAAGLPTLIVIAAAAALGFGALTVAHVQSVRSTPVRNHLPGAAANELYVSGLHEWQTRTPASLARAIVDFHLAIARAPDFAKAYAGLAAAYNLQREFSALPPEELYPKAEEAAAQAIALDPSLASAHAALAFDLFYWSRNPSAAQKEFNIALALDPESAVTHEWYATCLMTLGEFAPALIEIEKAQNLDSESAAILADKGLILFYTGREKQAIELLTQLENDQPLFSSPHDYLQAIWFDTGNYASYLRELELTAAARHDSNVSRIAAFGVKGLVADGRTGMLRGLLMEQRRLFALGKESAYALAKTYAALNDTPAAKEYLAISLSRREPANIAIKIEPTFKPMRNEVVFANFVEKAGLVIKHTPPS
jgi:tetratricopeptide (TPR) repeat protein